MEIGKKIKLLNALLAGSSPFSKDIYFQAAHGIDAALSECNNILPIGEIAKNIIAIYDENAQVETLEFSGRFFDPLFALPLLSAAAKRLAGSKRAILIISGLKEASFDGSKNESIGQKKRFENNREIMEDYIYRYCGEIDRLEIIFL